MIEARIRASYFQAAKQIFTATAERNPQALQQGNNQLTVSKRLGEIKKRIFCREQATDIPVFIERPPVIIDETTFEGIVVGEIIPDDGVLNDNQFITSVEQFEAEKSEGYTPLLQERPLLDFQPEIDHLFALAAQNPTHMSRLANTIATIQILQEEGRKELQLFKGSEPMIDPIFYYEALLEYNRAIQFVSQSDAEIQTPVTLEEVIGIIQTETNQPKEEVKPSYTAIPTRYDKYLFRSRKEARWAVFFQTLQIPFNYEEEGFEIEGTKYLPDFFIESLDSYIEIKGTEPTEEEIEKAHKLALATGKKIYIFFDQLMRSEPDINCRSAYKIEGDTIEDMHKWCECPQCGVIGISRFGNSAQLSCGCNSSNTQQSNSIKIDEAFIAASTAQFQRKGK